MYRLVFDIEMGDDKSDAVSHAQSVIENLQELFGHSPEPLIVKYRLQRDEDRQVKNYLTENANGHVGHKKSVL